MDSNRRSSAEFGNFVLAAVSFGVSQSSNGLRTIAATPSVALLRLANDLFAGNAVGAIATHSCGDRLTVTYFGDAYLAPVRSLTILLEDNSV